MRTISCTVLLAFLAAAGGCSDAPDATRIAQAAADGKTYVLTVEGMTCALNCAPAVKASLESIAGVKRVAVSFEEKRAVVVMQAGHSLTTAAADKSFGNDGYFVSELSEVDPDAGDRDGEANPQSSAGGPQG